MSKPVVASLLVGAATFPTAWATELVHFSSPGSDYTNLESWTLGFAFHVDSPVVIDGLSIYDDLRDGLLGEHPAGVWSADGTLLASTVIPAGTAAPLDGWFRVQSIAPLTLPVGDYVVGVRTGTENYVADPEDFGTASGITFLENRFVNSAGLAIPTEVDDFVSIGWFGGNARLQPTPDTGSAWVFFGTASVGLLALRRRAA